MLTGGSSSFTIATGALNSCADTLTASFSGNGAYATAMGTATVKVSPVGMAIPAPAPVSFGASVTGRISATDSYSGTLELKCTLPSSPTSALSPPTCALNPTEVNFAAGGNGTAAITVNTTAASTSALAPPLRQIPFSSAEEARCSQLCSSLEYRHLVDEVANVGEDAVTQFHAHQTRTA
jgi:hypothetical protein